MIYGKKNGEYLEILLRNRRFRVKVCCGWGRSLLSATISILLTREIFFLMYSIVDSLKLSFHPSAICSILLDFA